MRQFQTKRGSIFLATLFFSLMLSSYVAGQGNLIPIGVCTSSKNMETLKLARASYIEEGVSGYLMPAKSDAEFSDKLRSLAGSDLEVRSANSFFPSTFKLVGPEANHAEALAWAEIAMRRSSDTRLKTIVLGSGGARRIPEGFDRDKAESQFIEFCKSMGPIAAKYGVMVVIEPLNSRETNFINSVSEGAAVVKKINHPNIQLLADFYHMAMENEPAQAIVDAGEYIKHCHVAEKQGRTAPGVNGDDFTPYFKALAQIGYKGMISIECSWRDFAKEVSTAIAVLRKQMSEQ